MTKEAYIGKLKGGKWRVYSMSGKNMGTYKSRSLAQKRLNQIEMFKHMGKKKKSRKRSLLLLEESIKIAKKDEGVNDTYSSVMRSINKHNPKDLKKFMKAFLRAFNKAVSEDVDDHRDVALLEAKQSVSSVTTPKLVRLAQAIMGVNKNPDEIGVALAGVLKILLDRVPHKNVYENMRNKISMLSPTEIAVKTLPDTAAYGQSITLIKTLLNGYSPDYVRHVLSTTIKNLH